MSSRLNTNAILERMRPASQTREAWHHLLAPVAELSDGLPAPITGVMLTLWKGRPDLQELYPLTTREDRIGFVMWCLLPGRKEYRILEETCGPASAALARPAVDIPEDVFGPVLSALMHQVHQSRGDLKSSFDLGTRDGRLHYLIWFLLHGREEVGFTGPLPDWQVAFLASPYPDLPQDDPLPISWLMALVHRFREDLRQSFDLGKTADRERYRGWFFLHGVQMLRLPSFPTEDEAKALAAPVLEDENGLTISRFGFWIWLSDEDLQMAFPLNLPEARVRFLEWLQEVGAAKYGLPQAQRPRDTVPAYPAEGDRRPGLNLIGYAFGEFGIGEDVRMAARACDAIGVPFGIINVEPGEAVRQNDTSLVRHVRDRLEHAVNVLCMTSFETARTFAQLGRAAFEGRFTIGYWPWELPESPPDWGCSFDFVDEVWVSSRYTQNAFETVSPVPVVYMPMAVTVDAPRTVSRRDFGLPEDRFLFVFSFDGLSYLTRKNPLGVVTAFTRAFPQGSEPVGLVIKAMNVAGLSEWTAIRTAAERDPRIVLITATMDRAAVLGLYAACNAFVSLHRAEGFGRGLAEAMLLGKPVVATGFSGNLEFTTPDTARMVRHRLVPIGDGEYPCGDGQVWAEPDLDHAAEQMRVLATNPATAQALGAAGRTHVHARHGPAVVGARYRKRLMALGLLPP